MLLVCNGILNTLWFLVTLWLAFVVIADCLW